MKKFLAMLTATLLLGATLAACGGSADSAAPADTGESAAAETGSAPAQAAESTGEGSDVSGTISLLSWYDETKAEPFLTAFNTKYPNVKIDFQYSPPVKDYVEKLSTLLYSGSAPDVFQMSLENREDLIKGGYCLDLSDQPYMQDGTIPDLVKTTYGADGKPYSLAVDGWVGGIFYNKRMFSEAGIENEPQTWDEFLEVCGKLKDAGFNPLMDNCQDAAVNFVPALVGAQTISKDPDFTSKVYAGETTFEEGWSEPLQMWYQLIEEGYLNKDMVGITSEQMVTEFATETVAMIPTGPWNVNTINEINPELDYKCMGIPGKEAGNIWYDGAVNVGLCVNSASENQELALLLLEFAASPEGLQAQYEGYGSTIIAQGFTSEGTPQMSQAEEAFREGKTYIPMGDWMSYSEPLRNTYLTSLQDCLIGKIAPEDVAKNMDAKLQEMQNG